MITEFKVDRRYKIGNYEYKCVAIHRGLAALQSDKCLQVEIITPWLLENSIELPPEPGEYYEGEEVVVFLPWLNSSCNAKYISTAGKDWHVVQQDGVPPNIVKVSQINRPTSKPKTIRRPPTDQDAIEQPRRKCWVRGKQDEPWHEAELISVEKNAVRNFVAREPCCIADYYLYCEIAVPNE